MDPATFRRVSFVFLAGLLLVGAGLAFPLSSANEDASVANDGPRGASQLAGIVAFEGRQAGSPPAQHLYTSLESMTVEETSEDGVGDTLILLGPSVPFSEDEADRVEAFLNESGRVVLADDTGHANSLLEQLDTSTRVDNASLIDVAYRRQPFFPVLFTISAHPLTEDVDEVVANVAGSVRPDADAQRLIASSRSSWLDRDGDGVPSEGDPRGPHTVMSVEPVGEGQLVVLSDPSILSNAMLGEGDNQALAGNLARQATQIGAQATWDETHRDYRPFALVAHALPHASPPATAITLLVLAALPAGAWAGLRALAWAYERWLSPKRDPETTIERVLASNPAWREDRLRRVAEQIASAPTPARDDGTQRSDTR